MMAMDITSAAVATRTAPDSDADTPPRPTSNKPTGFLAYANGALKRHYPTAPKTESPAAAEAVSYRECMRNHAATIGGHALDGCCEFMPSPMFNPSDPTTLRCAACGCHRNFHRRDPDDPAPLQLHRQIKNPALPFPFPPPPADSPSSPPTPATLSSTPQTLMALRKSQSGGVAPAASGGGKKRFRTKFSQEQKEKMYDFAERLGWKMQKMDKLVVEEFCTEIGVGKEVLKVWLHNNKNTLTLGRRRDITAAAAAATTTTTNGQNNETVADAAPHKNGGDHFQRVHLLPANASSSSSG